VPCYAEMATQVPGRGGYAALWTAQAAAALVDNAARQALVGAAASGLLVPWGLGTAEGGAALFALCALALSGMGGVTADRVGAVAVARETQSIGILGAATVALGLVADIGLFGMVGLSLLAYRAALFGPSKYAVLPALVGEEAAVAASGLVAASTLVSVLLGTALGAFLSAQALAALLVAGSLVSFGASWLLPDVPGYGVPRQGLLPATLSAVRAARSYEPVWLAALGITWLWTVGVLVIAALPTLPISVAVAPLLLGVGTVAGAAVAHGLSRHRVELGIVPVGTLGLSFAALLLALPLPPLLAATALVTLGLAAAVFVVPLYAFVAFRTAPERRGLVIAGNNVVNAVGMFAAAYLATWEPNRWQLFGGLAIANLLVAAYVYSRVPEFLLRLAAWALGNVLYRLEIDGLERIPKEGPALIVANHVTFVDWLILAGAVKRPVRFVMYAGYYTNPLVKWLVDQGRVIPIAGKKEDPARLEAAFDAISNELRSGEIVGIFPEGKLSTDGSVDVFRPGVERILARDPVPVVPVALNGLWGSWFSRERGVAMRKVPRRFWSRIFVTIGDPIPPAEVNAELLRTVVVGLWRKRPSAP
jgi:1-acyl-sn-glycerol-3-phosphate acyltransferase